MSRMNWQEASNDHEALADARGYEDDAIVDWFWDAQFGAGYEVALKLTADKFGKSCAYVERLLIEQDEMDNGNV